MILQMKRQPIMSLRSWPVLSLPLAGMLLLSALPASAQDSNDTLPVHVPPPRTIELGYSEPTEDQANGQPPVSIEGDGLTGGVKSVEKIMDHGQTAAGGAGQGPAQAKLTVTLAPDVVPLGGGRTYKVRLDVLGNRRQIDRAMDRMIKLQVRREMSIVLGLLAGWEKRLTNAQVALLRRDGILTLPVRQPFETLELLSKPALTVTLSGVESVVASLAPPDDETDEPAIAPWTAPLRPADVPPPPPVAYRPEGLSATPSTKADNEGSTQEEPGPEAVQPPKESPPKETPPKVATVSPDSPKEPAKSAQLSSQSSAGDAGKFRFRIPDSPPKSGSTGSTGSSGRGPSADATQPPAQIPPKDGSDLALGPVKLPDDTQPPTKTPKDPTVEATPSETAGNDGSAPPKKTPEETPPTAPRHLVPEKPPEIVPTAATGDDPFVVPTGDAWRPPRFGVRVHVEISKSSAPPKAGRTWLGPDGRTYDLRANPGRQREDLARLFLIEGGQHAGHLIKIYGDVVFSDKSGAEREGLLPRPAINEVVSDIAHGADLLAEAGIPHLRVIEVIGGGDRPYIIQSRPGPDDVVIEAADGILSAGQQRAVVKLYNDLTQEDIIWADAYIGNIYFSKKPEQDAWVAGILNSDGIAKWRQLPSSRLKSWFADTTTTPQKRRIYSIPKTTAWVARSPRHYMGKMFEYSGWIEFRDGAFQKRRIDPRWVAERFPIKE